MLRSAAAPQAWHLLDETAQPLFCLRHCGGLIEPVQRLATNRALLIGNVRLAKPDGSQ
jgi:hypothetical protein